MKRIVTICLMLLFYCLAFYWIMLLTSLLNTEDNSDIESSSHEGDQDLAILPVTEKGNAETDKESDSSDDMNDGLVHHLPRCLLNSTCDSRLPDKWSVQRTQPPNKKSRKSAARNWKKGTELQPTLKLLEASAVPREWKEIIKSPIDAFKAMFLITWFCMWQIRLTFMQCNIVKVVLTFWRMKLGLLLGLAVLLSSGYCKVPYWNLSWADAPDTHKSHEVSCTVKKKRFREILSNLHLADNTQITEDRYYKIQVLFEKLISNSMVHLPITELIKTLSLTMENTSQKKLLEESPLDLHLNFGASPHLKDISFMQNHTIKQILICQILVWVWVQMLCWVWLKSVR